MIPKIVHQTWRDAELPPPFDHMARTWRKNHPDWTYRLWTDRDLDRLVGDHYPHLAEQFHAYSNPVQRADLGRYMVLHRFGGVYSDIDTTCLAAFDPLTGEDRIVVAEEPGEHLSLHGLHRGLDWMVFNGTIASPCGHPFWLEVLAMTARCRHARDVLEATGPLMLTGCMRSYGDPNAFARHSCHLFNPVTASLGASADREFGPYAGLRLSVHHWNGSWFHTRKRGGVDMVKRAMRKTRYLMTRGRILDPNTARAAVSGKTLLCGLADEPSRAGFSPADPNIAVFVPARDAEGDVPRCLELIGRLDIPQERLKLVFCEGDSADDTAGAIKRGLDALGSGYRGKMLLHHETGNRVRRSRRWDRRLQRVRRGGLARVRNHLVEAGLDDDDDWVLWIDVDVCDYPGDIVARLLRARAKIVVPNCVLSPGGLSFDMNSFLEVDRERDSTYYKQVEGGVFQPPAQTQRRRHLHDLRYLDTTPLTGVGGTMLLVHGSVFRAGLRFPEIPYMDLIETEGFGKLARDCGLLPIGLPNVEIVHKPR